jgi:hypothetical protein
MYLVNKITSERFFLGGAILAFFFLLCSGFFFGWKNPCFFVREKIFLTLFLKFSLFSVEKIFQFGRFFFLGGAFCFWVEGFSLTIYSILHVSIVLFN